MLNAEWGMLNAEWGEAQHRIATFRIHNSAFRIKKNVVSLRPQKRKHTRGCGGIGRRARLRIWFLTK